MTSQDFELGTNKLIDIRKNITKHSGTINNYHRWRAGRKPRFLPMFTRNFGKT